MKLSNLTKVTTSKNALIVATEQLRSIKNLNYNSTENERNINVRVNFYDDIQLYAVSEDIFNTIKEVMLFCKTQEIEKITNQLKDLDVEIDIGE